MSAQGHPWLTNNCPTKRAKLAKLDGLLFSEPHAKNSFPHPHISIHAGCSRGSTLNANTLHNLPILRPSLLPKFPTKKRPPPFPLPPTHTLTHISVPTTPEPYPRKNKKRLQPNLDSRGLYVQTPVKDTLEVLTNQALPAKEASAASTRHTKDPTQLSTIRSDKPRPLTNSSSTLGVYILVQRVFTYLVSGVAPDGHKRGQHDWCSGCPNDNESLLPEVPLLLEGGRRLQRLH